MPPNPSLAAIASAPSSGPWSFAGNDWLTAWNLGSSTALAIIAILFALDTGRHLWRNRKRDRWNHPVTIFRGFCLLIAVALILRKITAAYVLWKWNPGDPVGTNAAMILQRWIDPISDLLYLAAIALIILSARTLVDQLRKHPWKVPIVEYLPLLRRPLILSVISLIAAYGVVVTR